MCKTDHNNEERLFQFVFCRKENREWLLSMFNAFNGSHFTNPDDMWVRGIGDAIFMSMKNDHLFLIEDIMILTDRQSDAIRNAPLRMLLYSAKAYSMYTKDPNNRINMRSSKQQMLPNAKLISLCCGEPDRSDEPTSELQTAYPKGAEPDIRVKVTKLNVNDPRNQKLLDASEPLKEYVEFIRAYRQQRINGTDQDEALSKAIEKLSATSNMRLFLEANRADINRMCMTAYDEDFTIKLFDEE